MDLNIKKICLCGGGSQSHVIAAWLANKGYDVALLTRKPEDWSKTLTIDTPVGSFQASLDKISADAAEVIPNADVVLLTVPGYANVAILNKIKPYVKPGAFVGGVFCSSGFFFEALKILPSSVKLWGLQRVPFIARVADYGHRATLLGYRPLFKVATDRVEPKEAEAFADWISRALGSKTILLKNYLEVSITNSNPILHTSRLFTMFKDWKPGIVYPRNFLFYEEWTEEAAELMIKMDAELFSLLKVLPVSDGYLTPLLEYYESTDATSMARKLRSISGLKGITSPMKQSGEGWIPDYGNRYFREDFGYSLRYIYELALKHGISVPNIEKVYKWGVSVTEQSPE